MVRVSGIVLDRFTGDPIAGALVNIGYYRTTSGSDGRFEIEVEPGRYIVMCQAEGYETTSRVVDVTTDTSITFLLTPRAKLL